MNCPNCGAEYQVVFSGQTIGKVKRERRRPIDDDDGQAAASNRRVEEL